VRTFSAVTILQPAERLWRTLLPGSGDLTVGVINISLGFGGLDALETGQRGIEGFLGVKGASTSTSKPNANTSSSSAVKNRRTASPNSKKDAAKPKRDFFNTAAIAKRKVTEVIDDSDSDIVEISPPPHAKRTNTGSSGQTGGSASSRSGTPTPVASRKSEKAGAGKGKSKNKGIASFFVASGSGKVERK
jgi:hypothetical protein